MAKLILNTRIKEAHGKFGDYVTDARYQCRQRFKETVGGFV